MAHAPEGKASLLHASEVMSVVRHRGRIIEIVADEPAMSRPHARGAEPLTPTQPTTTALGRPHARGPEPLAGHRVILPADVVPPHVGLSRTLGALRSDTRKSSAMARGGSRLTGETSHRRRSRPSGISSSAANALASSSRLGRCGGRSGTVWAGGLRSAPTTDGVMPSTIAETHGEI